jgi:hypothetical protein
MPDADGGNLLLLAGAAPTPPLWSVKLMYFEPDIACAFTVTKLKHGFSNPYMF